MRLRSLIFVAFLVLFCSAALRHALFASTAYDLGLFDQTTFLISRGRTPLSTLLGFHILGDHTALIWYVLALPYRLVPSPYWLLWIQSMGLAFAAVPLWAIARSLGLGERDSTILAAGYLLYPVVFNANLADFHPESLAVPGLFLAILAARRDQMTRFVVSLVLVLSCKSILGLTVVALGVWLFLSDTRRIYGAVAVALGSIWFGVANFILVPWLAGADASVVVGDERYRYLGSSLAGIVGTLATQPWRILGHLVSISSLGYLLGLFGPCLWALRRESVLPLLGALPTILLNLLSDARVQRHLTNQYSLPVLPFLFVSAAFALSGGKMRRRDPHLLLLWAGLSFLIFARYPRLVGYVSGLSTVAAQQAAVSAVEGEEGVVADSCLLPHLSHRSYVERLVVMHEPAQLRPEVRYVVVNTHRPCEISSEQAAMIAGKFRGDPSFEVAFERDGVVVFRKRLHTS